MPNHHPCGETPKRYQWVWEGLRVPIGEDGIGSGVDGPNGKPLSAAKYRLSGRPNRGLDLVVDSRTRRLVRAAPVRQPAGAGVFCGL